jgi:hypothetical protein
MGNQRRIHDSAWALATVVTERLENAVRPEEVRDLFEMVYECAHAAFSYHESLVERERKRLNPVPSKN